MIKELFEINEYKQKGLKVAQNASKHGVEEQFSFCPFEPLKSDPPAYALMMQWRVERDSRVASN